MRYPKSLYSYNYIITGPEYMKKNFYFTNNLFENINRYLNKNLKKGICSNFIFRNSILSIIDQFENKIINQTIENKKSDILTFYINKEKEVKILNTSDIRLLSDIYNEVQFININKNYIELNKDELDIIYYEDEELNS